MRSWLRELRLSKKLTQEELASMIGVSQAMYSKIENGDRQQKMNLLTASNIAKVFKISLKRINEYEEAIKKGEQAGE